MLTSSLTKVNSSIDSQRLCNDIYGSSRESSSSGKRENRGGGPEPKVTFQFNESSEAWLGAKFQVKGSWPGSSPKGFPGAESPRKKLLMVGKFESAAVAANRAKLSSERSSSLVPYVSKINSSTRLLLFGRSLPKISDYALAEINKWPTRPQELGNFLASLDKLRARDETSPQVIARASQKLNDILDEIETKPAILPGNGEFKVGAVMVRMVKWSPDGERFAVASSEGCARIYDVASGTCKHFLHHEADEVRCVQWNRKGDMLASGGSDGYLRVFDTTTGSEVLAHAHNGTVRDVQWCPQGTRLATASFDNMAAIFDTLLDKRIEIPHGDKVRHVRWDPSGKRLATASSEHVARIYCAFTGEVLIKIDHDHELQSVEWNAEGTRLATSCHDKNVYLWNVEKEGFELECRMLHGDSVRCLAFSPDSKRLATASRDKVARVFDVNGKSEMKAYHHGKVLCVQWSRDGETLATASQDGFARVFCVLTGSEKARWSHNGCVEHIDWNPHGQLLLTASFDSCVRLFNVGRDAEHLKFRHNDVVRHVQWAPVEPYVATASFDCFVRVFRIPSGNLIHRLNLEHKVRDVQWSADGKKIAASADNNTVHVYHMDTGELVYKYMHPDRVPNVQWIPKCNPESTLLATACFDKNARIFDMQGNEIKRWGHESAVLHAEWSHDGKLLATLSLRDRVCRIFDVSEDIELCVLEHEDWVLALEWNPKHHQLIVTASDDKSVKLWDAQQGLELCKWGHEDVVQKIVRWSPGGTHLATAPSSACNQHFVSIFEIAEGKRKWKLEHWDKIQDVQWSAGAEMLSTASSDKHARIFDMSSGDEVARWLHGGVVRDAMWSPCGQWLGTSCGDGFARIFNASFAVKVSMHFNRTLSSRRRDEKRLARDTVADLKSKRRVHQSVHQSASAASMPSLQSQGSNFWDHCPFSEVIRLPCGGGRLPLQRAMINDQSPEFGQVDLKGMHLLFDNGGFTLPPSWSMNLSTLHMAMYTAIMADQGCGPSDDDEAQTEMGSKGNLGYVLDMLMRCGAKDTIFYSDLFGLNVLDLALRLKQPAMALDVLLPEVMDKLRQEPLQAYRSGFDISLGRVVGALTTRGEATALTRITLPEVLDMICFDADPESWGLFHEAPPPRLASKDAGLRTVGSDTPWVGERDFKHLLPWGSGLNVPTSLEVVLLADVLSSACKFFQGLCTVPQENEHELWTHRAVKAFVHYKWHTCAKYRFYALCLDYFCFLATFTVWSCLSEDESVSSDSSDEREGHSIYTGSLPYLKIAVVLFMIPIAGVEVKQFYISRAAHFQDYWNLLTASCIIAVIGSLVEINDTWKLNLQPYAAVLAWANGLYYMRGFHMTGPYIKTLGAILCDLRGFLIVFITLQIGFSHAMYLSLTEQQRNDQALQNSSALPRLFHVLLRTYMIGVLGEVTKIESYSYMTRYVLFFVVTFAVTIVLLNTLIAAISETFDRLQEHSESSWVRGRAQLISEMELVFGKQEAPPYVVFNRERHGRVSSEDDNAGKITIIKRTIAEEVKKAEGRLRSNHVLLETQFENGIHELSARLEHQGKILESISAKLGCSDWIAQPRKASREKQSMRRSSDYRVKGLNGRLSL